MTRNQARRERHNRDRLARQLAIVADEGRSPRDRKRASRLAAAIAEKLGVIKRPRACQWCRRRGVPLERHHHDHGQPLAVAWLCRPCHDLGDLMASDGAVDGGDGQDGARMVG